MRGRESEGEGERCCEGERECESSGLSAGSLVSALSLRWLALSSRVYFQRESADQGRRGYEEERVSV